MINNIEVFDVNGDGTLIIKTNLNDTYENAKFAWYISYNGHTIYKGAYQRNPYMSYKIESLGKYTIKSFVKTDTDKINEEIVFEANKLTSPQLAIATTTSNIKIKPIAEKVSDGFWRFDVETPVSDDATYAWYIYRSNNEQPYFKQMYTKYSEYIHNFKESGTYYAKLFVISGGIKKSVKTETFTVSVDK